MLANFCMPVSLAFRTCFQSLQDYHEAFSWLSIRSSKGAGVQIPKPSKPPTRVVNAQKVKAFFGLSTPPKCARLVFLPFFGLVWLEIDRFPCLRLVYLDYYPFTSVIDFVQQNTYASKTTAPPPPQNTPTPNPPPKTLQKSPPPPPRNNKKMASEKTRPDNKPAKQRGPTKKHDPKRKVGDSSWRDRKVMCVPFPFGYGQGYAGVGFWSPCAKVPFWSPFIGTALIPGD